MGLTTTQLQSLKNDIAADQTLSALPHTDDNAYAVAAAYNSAASPDFYVWRTAVPIDDVRDQINWANYTPSDAPPTDTVLNSSVWQSRALECQGKQFNLQTLLMGKTTLDASRANVRAGLNDATTALPSGPSGANRSGGWANIAPVLAAKATRAQKLFSTGAGTNVSPASMDANIGDGFTLDYSTVLAAWNS